MKIFQSASALEAATTLYANGVKKLHIQKKYYITYSTLLEESPGPLTQKNSYKRPVQYLIFNLPSTVELQLHTEWCNVVGLDNF
jgi:hypothetical protein